MPKKKESDNKLEPCPFCGGPAYVGIEYYASYWTVGCSKCFCVFERYFKSKDEAIKKWNKRK